MTKIIDTPRTEVRGSNSVYHVWFSPRRRKAALQGDIAGAAADALRAIARRRGIHILECETYFDHAHLLLQLPENATLPQAMRHLKGASARYLFQTFPELKLDIGHDHFWQRGYGARAVGPGQLKTVRAYIRAHRPETEPRSLLRGAATSPSAT